MKLLSFKQFYLLQESYKSNIHSLNLLNLLFYEDKFDKYTFNRISIRFPINDDDRNSLVQCINAIYNNDILTKIDDYKFIDFEFTSDYGLSILNKLFNSKNNRDNMITFLNNNINAILTNTTIKSLAIQFHSKFVLD